jgi:hypothetical protein
LALHRAFLAGNSDAGHRNVARGMSVSPFQLDFRRPPRSSWHWLGWVLLAAVVAVATVLAEQHALLAQRHAAAQEHHAAVSQRLSARAPRRSVAAPDAQLLAEVRRANTIIDQLTVPWDGLFDAVEAADARGLGLLSLTPTARDRTLRLSGEARGVPELLAYVERLSEQPALGQVHLLGYSNTQREGAPIVSFTIAATWKGQP